MKLLFVGDVMLGRLMNEYLKISPPSYPWGDTLEIFKAADIRFCNLECVLSDDGVPWSRTPKIFHFRSDSKNVQVLKEAKIDYVSLANNHILDFETDALIDCLNILSENQINFSGAGKNIIEAEKGAKMQHGEAKIAVFAFSDNEPDWEAKEEEPGIFYLPINPDDGRVKHFVDLVNEARGWANLIIVSAHWGPNWGYKPPEEHISFAHHLIDSGVDIIFGHSSHVFRGVEIYKNCPIIYSAGDFIDDYEIDPVERNDQSFIYTLDYKSMKFSQLTLYPTVIENFQAHMARGSQASEISGKMQILSKAFGTELILKDNNLSFHNI